MSVSMATIPIIKGEAAKKMLEELKHPTLTEEFLAECEEVSKRLFGSEEDNK